MNEEEKQRYKERYKEKKADGEMFFPDTIAKDAVVSLGIFVLLILLVILLGVPNEPPANPSDSSYIPRPEWYFLWAFQLLKYFPGQIEGLAIVGLGLVIFLGLFGLPFFDRGPKRHPRNRPIATVVMLLIVAGIVFLTDPGRGDDAAAGRGGERGRRSGCAIEAGASSTRNTARNATARTARAGRSRTSRASLPIP